MKRGTYANTTGKAQPSQKWDQTPAGNGIDLTPNVDQICIEDSQRNDINGRFDGPLECEVERRKGEVEAELDRVKRCALLEQEFRLAGYCRSGAAYDVCAYLGQFPDRRVEGSATSLPGTEGRVAHESEQHCPGRAEKPSRWAKGWLLQLEVPLFHPLVCYNIQLLAMTGSSSVSWL